MKKRSAMMQGLITAALVSLLSTQTNASTHDGFCDSEGFVSSACSAKDAASSKKTASKKAETKKIPKMSVCDSEGFESSACLAIQSKSAENHQFLDWLEKVKINGWLDLDAAKYSHYPAVTPFSSGAIIRTARLNIRGYVEQNWRYSIGFAFFNNTISMKQAFIAYTGVNQTEFRVGQMKVPFSLEELTNDRYTTFLEEGLPVDILAPEYRLGGGAFHYGSFENPANTYTLSGGVYTDKAGERVSGASGSIAGIARATYAYVPSSRRVAMIGAAVDMTRPDSNHIVSYDGFPESRVSTNQSSRLVGTGDIFNVNDAKLYDVQGATVYGPLSFQSEYIADSVDRTGVNPTLHFDGWYAFVSWVFTGENRSFDVKNAIFTGVDPKHRYGAWEWVERVSHIDLNSNAIAGGKEKDYTSGLNWYLNPSVRFMFNYIKAFSTRNATESNPNIYTVRAEVDFP